MTLDQEVAQLVQAANDLLAAVNISKTVLDEKVLQAQQLAQAVGLRFYPQSYTQEPATRPDGSAIEVGDMYYNSVLDKTAFYTGAGWFIIDTLSNESAQDILAIAPQLQSVVDNLPILSQLSQNLVMLQLLGNQISGLEAIALNLTALLAVSQNLTSVQTVANIQANVAAVAQRTAQIQTVVDNIADIDALVANMTAINQVAVVRTSVTTVAQNLTPLQTTADSIGSVVNVGQNIASVNTLAGISSSLVSLNSNLSLIQAAITNLSTLSNAFASAVAAQASADTAAARSEDAAVQARLAATFAAAASSVVQQDLSGVTTAGLHFTPNAIGDIFIYNTNQDSNGGAWIDAAGWQSWMNEPLNGPWLANNSAAGYQSELAARAVGATLGNELNPSLTYATGWTPGANTTIQGGKLVVSGGNMTSALTSVAGAANTIYLVTITIDTLVPLGSDGGISVQIGGTNSAIFRTAGTFTDVVVGINTSPLLVTQRNSGITTGTVIGAVSARPITQFNTVSGSYYNLATDGRHYRLWKNLLQGSSSFSTGSGWLHTNGGTAVDNSIFTPDNTPLSLITEGSTGGSATNQVLSNLAAPAGITVTLRALIARGNNDWHRFLIGDSSTTNHQRVWINTATGVLGTQASSGSTPPTIINPWAIRSVGAGVFELTVTVRLNVAGVQVQTYNTPADNNSGGLPTTTRYLGGVQLEYGTSFTGLETKAGGVGSQSETTRGNTARIPRQPAIVPETAGGITIYDLTAPGRPMWMRFNIPSTTAGILSLANNGEISVAMRDGVLVAGAVGAFNGLKVIDFVRDVARTHRSVTSSNGTEGWWWHGIAQRNSTTLRHSNWSTPVKRELPAIAGESINAVAITVLPNAPIDQATGLPVPTIACAVGSGNAGQVGSVLMHDGTVVNYTQSSNDGAHVAFTTRGEVVWGLANATSCAVMPLATSTATNIISGLSGVRVYANSGSATAMGGFGTGTRKRGIPLRNPGRLAIYADNQSDRNVWYVHENPASPAAGLMAQFTSSFNTGFQVGDSRGVWMADTSTLSATSPELYTAGIAITGWADGSAGAGSTLVVNGSELQLTSTGSSGRQLWAFPTEVNKTYRVQATFRRVSGASVAIGWALGATGASPTLVTTTSTSNVTRNVTFTATGTTSYIVLQGQSAGDVAAYSAISAREVVADRSPGVVGSSTNDGVVVGTLTRSAVAAGSQMVGYSGFSASNYIQIANSSLHSYGTAGFTYSAYLLVTAAQLESVWQLGSENITNGTFDVDASGWSGNAAATLSVVGGALQIVNNSSSEGIATFSGFSVIAGRTYRLSWRQDQATGRVSISNNASATYTFSAAGTYTQYFVATASGSVQLRTNTSTSGTTVLYDNVSLREVLVPLATIMHYGAASGAYWMMAVNPMGQVVIEASDGSTVRTVLSNAIVTDGRWHEARAIHDGSGSLNLWYDGRLEASAVGTPLNTLTTANAVITIGNSFALNTPFPGTLCMAKTSATVPNANQIGLIFNQERPMFNPGAQVTLSDSGAVLRVVYDDIQDRVVVLTAANVMEFSGFVRLSSTVVGGSANHTRNQASAGGVRVIARLAGTARQALVTIPPRALQSELMRRAEEAARLVRVLSEQYYDAFEFTAATTSGSRVVTASSIVGTPQTNVAVECANFPADTQILAISGSTYYMSAPATATGSVTARQRDFILPAGQEVVEFQTAGVLRREGATRDYIRLFDGFVERVRMVLGQAGNTWARVLFRRIP